MIKTIIFGAVMLFGVPILIGIALASWVDTLLGIIGGVLIFLIIVGVAFRYMRKEADRNNRTED